MRCEELAPALAGVVDGSLRLDRGDRRHVEQCLRCQAELARYRRLRRAASTLRAEVIAPPPSLLHDVLVSVEEGGDRPGPLGGLTARRAAYLGGLAAATAAAGAGAAIVLVSRGRRARLPLAG